MDPSPANSGMSKYIGRFVRQKRGGVGVGKIAEIDGRNVVVEYFESLGKRTRETARAGHSVPLKPGASRRAARGATSSTRSRPVSTPETPATRRAAATTASLASGQTTVPRTTPRSCSTQTAITSRRFACGDPPRVRGTVLTAVAAFPARWCSRTWLPGKEV